MSETDHSNSTESVRAACPLCTRIITRDEREELQEIIDHHNEQRHGGDDVAQIVANTTDALNEFMDDVREKHGSAVYREMGTHIVNADPWNLL